MRYKLIQQICIFLISTAAFAQDIPPVESDYYKIITLPVPEGITLEVGGLATLPNGNLGVSTRRGDVWIVENPYMQEGSNPHFRHFASGMHENLGLAYKNGDFYVAQRGELTRLRDTNGDGRADIYEAVYVWPISGHYHEYSFGPKIAPDGSFFVTGNVAFGDPDWWSGKSKVPWRGWTMRITPDGEMEPFATGMRSPCGIGMIGDEFFYADNQGDWMGSGGLVHVEKGDFTGHPAGLRWAGKPESPVKLSSNDIYYRVSPRFAAEGRPPTKPENIADERPTPLFELAADLPAIKLPAVWLPHGVLGISTSEIIQDKTGGQFGPFKGQLFIGDQGQSKIVRVFLEKVKGEYQGAAFGFIEGFQSGVLRMAWGRDGSMFVGQTNRGWGSTGKDPYGLQRLVWTGTVPFEMKSVKAMPDGFEIEFTQPVDKASAAKPEAYQVTSFIYKYHPVYGSPAVNDEDCPVRGVVVSKDGLRARIVVDNLREKYIHEIKLTDVRNYTDGHLPLHATAYYTLNNIPDGEKLKLPDPPASKPKSMKHHQHHQKTTDAAPKAEKDKPKTAPKKPAKPKKKVTKSTGKKRQTKQPANWSKVDQTVVLATLPGLRYDQSNIKVKAGSRVKWSFYNNDDMPHNVVIVKPGKADAVGTAAIALGIKGTELNHIPKTSDVLFHTRLMPPGTSESIYFEAPKQPGSYIYVCTVPGHHKVMRGTLVVVP